MERTCPRCVGKGTIWIPDCSLCQDTGLSGPISSRGQKACSCSKGEFWRKLEVEREFKQAKGEKE